jgi:hypothetical protein
VASPQAIPSPTATSINETPAQEEEEHYNRDSKQEINITEDKTEGKELKIKDLQIELDGQASIKIGKESPGSDIRWHNQWDVH